MSAFTFYNYQFEKIEEPIEPNLFQDAPVEHGVGSTDHFSALKIWMFENKFVFLPSHLKTIEPMARPIREKAERVSTM